MLKSATLITAGQTQDRLRRIGKLTDISQLADQFRLST